LRVRAADRRGRRRRPDPECPGLDPVGHVVMGRRSADPPSVAGCAAPRLPEPPYLECTLLEQAQPHDLGEVANAPGGVALGFNRALARRLFPRLCDLVGPPSPT